MNFYNAMAYERENCQEFIAKIDVIFDIIYKYKIYIYKHTIDHLGSRQNLAFKSCELKPNKL